MPKETIVMEIEAPCETVFDLIHDYNQRLKWDSMLSKAFILGDAQAAGKGVRTRCVGKWSSGKLALETEYVNFERGRIAAVKLTGRTPFFAHFAASIRHEPVTETRSRVIYVYSFRAGPKALAFLLEPIMNVFLRSETKARLQSLRDFLERE